MQSKDAERNSNSPPPEPSATESRSNRSLLHDERAIEGLPIRLVIAIVVGVAAMAIMMGLLGNIGTSPGQTELEAHLNDEVVYTEEIDGQNSQKEISIEVVSEDGEPVEEGRVMIEAGTAQLDTPQTLEIGESQTGPTPGDNEVVFELDDDGGNEVALRSDQNQGTLKITIFPPSDSDYSDSLENAEIIVIDGKRP